MESSSLLLTQRPASSEVTDCFTISAAPLRDLDKREVLLQTLWLSVEPYMMLAMAGAISSRPRRGGNRMQILMGLYASGVQLNDVMCGPCVCRVLKSRHPEFTEGDLVTSYSGWQTHAIDDGSVLRRITPGAIPLSAYLGVLGIPGLTGYAGMKSIGQPKEGETVVVSASIGAVGAVAADVARQHGAVTVGITSGPAKCAQLVNELGFAKAVDRRGDDFPKRLAESCPRGIDVYFENVGGAVWRAVFPLLRFFARVPVSGTVADYAPHAAVEERDRVPELMKKVMLHRLTIRGLAVFDYTELEDEFLEVMTSRIKDGAFRYAEEVYSGFDQAPKALSDIVNGRTVGKVVVKVSD